jgi:hypothetical protein
MPLMIDIDGLNIRAKLPNRRTSHKKYRLLFNDSIVPVGLGVLMCIAPYEGIGPMLFLYSAGSLTIIFYVLSVIEYFYGEEEWLVTPATLIVRRRFQRTMTIAADKIDWIGFTSGYGHWWYVRDYAPPSLELKTRRAPWPWRFANNITADEAKQFFATLHRQDSWLAARIKI